MMQRVPCLGAVGLGDVQEGPRSHPGSGEMWQVGPTPASLSQRWEFERALPSPGLPAG